MGRQHKAHAERLHDRRTPENRTHKRFRELMMATELYYFGKNTALAGRLSACAEALNLPYHQNARPDNLSESIFFFTESAFSDIAAVPHDHALGILVQADGTAPARRYGHMARHCAPGHRPGSAAQAAQSLSGRPVTADTIAPPCRGPAARISSSVKTSACVRSFPASRTAWTRATVI